MGFWEKLLSNKGKPARPTRVRGAMISFQVRCDKCKEEINLMVNRSTDLQSLYLDPGETGAAYKISKEILGNNCPNLINITVEMDRNYRILSRDISGGKFVREK